MTAVDRFSRHHDELDDGPVGPHLLPEQARYYRLGVHRPTDDKILEAIDKTRARGKLGITWL